MPRILLRTACAALVLFFLFGAVVWALVDVNALKTQVEQVVRANLDRTLRIEGDLGLSLFPRVSVLLPATSLSERESARTFARMDSVRIGVALLPLLAGRFEADGVSVTGLSANIERHPDGRSNIDDLIGRDLAASAQMGGRRSGAAPSFEFGRVELIDARVTVVDAGRPALIVSRLNLSTERLAPKPSTSLKLSAAFDAPGGEVRGVLALSTTLGLDLESGTFNLRSLETRVSGSSHKSAFDLHLEVERFSFADSIAADGVRVRLWPTGKSELQVMLALDGIAGTPAQLTVGSVRANAEYKRNERTITARWTSSAQFSLEAQSLRMDAIDGDVTVDDPGMTERITLALTGHIATNVAAQTAGMEFEGRLDGGAMEVGVDIAGFERPRIRVELDAERLNVDRYIRKPSAAVGEVVPVIPAASDVMIDLSPLRRLDVSCRARIGALTIAGLSANALNVTARAGAGRLDVAFLAADLYGGRLNSSVFADADSNRFGFEADLADVAMEPLLRDAFNERIVAGTGRLHMQISTQAGTSARGRRALEGVVSLDVRDGVLMGLDLWRSPAQARALMRAARLELQHADLQRMTDFTHLSAVFGISDGVASSSNVAMRSPRLQLAGSGSIDIGDGRFDYAGRMILAEGTQSDGSQALSMITVPIRLQDAGSRPSYEIDWARAKRSAVSALPSR